MSRVTAILPVFNGRRFLREAVRSVLAQSLPPCELIVVDDGSTDDSLAALEGLPPAPFPIRVLRQTNAGQSAARNLAARHAEGEYLASLDQDDHWYPQHLERLVAPLEADAAVGWSYCDFDEMDFDGNLVTRAFLRAQGLRHPKRSIFECVAADLMALPSASVIRRAAFEQVAASTWRSRVTRTTTCSSASSASAGSTSSWTVRCCASASMRTAPRCRAASSTAACAMPRSSRRCSPMIRA
jgi:glycosyltransferase involved in cell wall biosynthesis